MLNTVIFDMDGLLIDSEPLWQKAGMQTLQEYGLEITLEQYHQTTGLRTKEWIEWWFSYFNVSSKHAEAAIRTTEEKAIENIRAEGEPYPGTNYILDFFKERNYTIGLATSSPMKLVNVVIDKLGIRDYFRGYSSAEFLNYGKPHPQVYMNCAQDLQVNPTQCLCFEDSFNGLIAAKAAKMKCVVVPAPAQLQHPKWFAADLKLAALGDFTEDLLQEVINN